VQPTDTKLLINTAGHLINRLREFEPPLQLIADRRVQELPLVRGAWITLAKWPKFPQLGITFDRCKGFEEPKFWIGLYWQKEDKLRSFLTRNGLAHRLELRDADYNAGTDGWTLKQRPSKRDLEYPVLETYKNGAGSYFGVYDTGTKGKPHKLNVTRAMQFVQRVIDSVSAFPLGACPSNRIFLDEDGAS
jgi:hypothetical protein